MSMLHPSYKEMIEKMNKDAKDNPDAAEITSRYSLVIAAAKRARQINAGADPYVEAGEKERNLSVAVKEIFNNKVHVLNEEAALAAAKRLEDEAGDAEEFNAEEAGEFNDSDEAAEE